MFNLAHCQAQGSARCSTDNTSTLVLNSSWRILDELYDGIYFVDTERIVRFWNKGAERITGYTRDEILGRVCGDLLLGEPDTVGRCLCRETCPIVQTLNSGEPTCDRMLMRRRDGQRIAVDVHVSPVRDDSGQLVGGVEVFRDASAEVALHEAFLQMRRMAQTDPLTGLANRYHFEAMLELGFELRMKAGAPFSLILADIDGFKRVNDQHGHLAGDRCLKFVASRLIRRSRSEDSVCRFGGDEFAILLNGRKLITAVRLATRLRRDLADRPSTESLGDIALTASFGVDEVRPDDTRESLLERIDSLLYSAKALGRNRVAAGKPRQRSIVPARPPF